MPLKATGPEVYVATMPIVLSNYYDYLVDIMNHMKSLKLKDRPGDYAAYFCDTILVDAELLGSAGSFKTNHLSYIIRILKGNFDYRFHLWVTHKYKEVMTFIKKLCVCDEDLIRLNDVITYGSLVQEAMHEYRNIFDSKRWEPTDSKNISKDEPLLLMSSTAAIEYLVNKTMEKLYSKIRHKEKDNEYGVGSYTKSVATCHKCGKDCHF